MKKSISVSLLLLLAIFWSCSDSPNPDQEFIKTATITVNGHADKKVEFLNNGIQYTGAFVYYPVLNAESTDWVFPSEPDQKIDFIYEGDLMVKILETPFGAAEPNRFTDFEYRDSSMVTRTSPTPNTGFLVNAQWESFRMRSPEGGFYIYKDHLSQYENGNMIGSGFVSSFALQNTFLYKDKLWYFTKYTFDNRPNNFTNLGVVSLLNVGSIFDTNNKLTLQINNGQVITAYEYQYHADKLTMLVDPISDRVIRFQY
ncbi:MAG: hypothetical protein HWE21_17970 [Cytophagia bacterium]|nr:hypothetical protein [Cytophagia bacterium]